MKIHVTENEFRGTYYMKSLGWIYYSSKTSYWYNITWRNVISNDKNVNPVPVYCKSYLGLYTVIYDSYPCINHKYVPMWYLIFHKLHQIRTHLSFLVDTWVWIINDRIKNPQMTCNKFYFFTIVIKKSRHTKRTLSDL